MKKTGDQEANERITWEKNLLTEVKNLRTEISRYKSMIDSLRGHVVVPIEPTPDMLEAAGSAWKKDPLKLPITLWKAMIVAAGKQK